MYEEFFGLTTRPFVSVPRVDHYYPGAAIEAARHTLIRCVERAEGAGMVIGPSGTGKTLLSMVLAEHFRDAFQVALLSSGRLGTRRALLQAILFELGRPYRGMDEGELRLALMDHLASAERCPRGMLLLVDEAHTLPLRLLDEIRMITNLISGGQPRTRLVLAGSPLLEERFASPKLESFSQRIVARCYLESFSRDETVGFIGARLAAAGGEGREVIAADACRAVYQATDGVPRLVNQVCDHALLLACAAGRSQVDRAVVEEAWADLQQLPTPWTTGARDEPAGGALIEFGGLDSDPEESPEPADAAEARCRQGPSRTTLGISPAADGPSDPVTQVERIEQALGDLEDDFQPIAPLHPEVELVFDDPDDPFSEQFAEEEVVVDDYGLNPPIETPDQLRDGTGGDSRQSPYCDSAAERAISKEEEEEGSAGLENSEANRSQQPSGEGAFRRATSAASSAAARAERDDPNAPNPWDEEPETVPLRRQPQPEAAEVAAALEPVALKRSGVASDVESIIVVEEGYDDSNLPPPRPAKPVRPQEYAQLFARLRRGS